ncbi:hypothetical protein GGG16DRAFT_111722 [Schizophyllum commune]
MTRIGHWPAQPGRPAEDMLRRGYAPITFPTTVVAIQPTQHSDTLIYEYTPRNAVSPQWFDLLDQAAESPPISDFAGSQPNVPTGPFVHQLASSCLLPMQSSPHRDTPVYPPPRPPGCSSLFAPSTRPQSFRDAIGSDAHAAASISRRSSTGQEAAFVCIYCAKTFTRKSTRDDHVLRHENRKRYPCAERGCSSRFNTEGGLKSHLKNVHKLKLCRRRA